MAFTLEKVVPWGRNLEEYVRMFAMTDEDLQQKILGCGDGPASFNAEMRQQGHEIVSIEEVNYEFQRGANTMVRIH